MHTIKFQNVAKIVFSWTTLKFCCLKRNDSRVHGVSILFCSIMLTSEPCSPKWGLLHLCDALQQASLVIT